MYRVISINPLINLPFLLWQVPTNLWQYAGLAQGQGLGPPQGQGLGPDLFGEKFVNVTLTPQYPHKNKGSDMKNSPDGSADKGLTGDGTTGNRDKENQRDGQTSTKGPPYSTLPTIQPYPILHTTQYIPYSGINSHLPYPSLY